MSTRFGGTSPLLFDDLPANGTRGREREMDKRIFARNCDDMRYTPPTDRLGRDRASPPPEGRTDAAPAKKKEPS